MSSMFTVNFIIVGIIEKKLLANNCARPKSDHSGSSSRTIRVELRARDLTQGAPMNHIIFIPDTDSILSILCLVIMI